MKIKWLFAFILLTFSTLTISAPIRNVLIVVAMDSEAAPIIKLLHLSPVAAADNKLPMKLYAGKFDHLNIGLVLNGQDRETGVQNVGSEPAVLSTYLGISYFHPDVIMSIGTAGGALLPTVKPGSIYISERIKFYSRRMHSPLAKRYGIGNYASMDTKQLLKGLPFKYGIACSANSFDLDATETKIITEENCSALDMEAAGVAWVSMLKEIPMFAVKGITNNVNQANAHAQYKAKLNEVTNALADATKLILSRLAQA